MVTLDAMVQTLDQILRVHDSAQHALHLHGTLAPEGQVVRRVSLALCTWVFPHEVGTSCQTRAQVGADTYAVRMLSRATTHVEITDRKSGGTEASTQHFWPFLKNGHCLYAKSPRIWKLYQLGSNAIYALLAMTRSRWYLQKRLRQGNTCRETAQNILPDTGQGPPGPHRLWLCSLALHQFLWWLLKISETLSPSTSHGKDLHRACTWCLKSHLGFCPETSCHLVSFMYLHWKRLWKPFPILHHPGTQRLPSSLLSPLLQLEELYFLFLVRKKYHPFAHFCHPALNIFQSYSTSWEGVKLSISVFQGMTVNCVKITTITEDY